jgi:LCP family protein required for cell wall assembly
MCWVFGALFLVRFWYQEPIGESLSLPTMNPAPQVDSTQPVPPLEELEQIQETYQAETDQESNPTDDRELIFLAVAIDYRGETNYLYGLADSIRLVRVDFSVPQVNVVSLPRSLLVNVPTDRIRADNPVLLNQSYFFGTPGMQRYVGSGFGAGSLAETIQYNFGVSADHYVVIDFRGFIQLVDALGGIEVDLPYELEDDSGVIFPAGKQLLNGEQALQLARIRMKYGDQVRTENQNLVLQAIFQRLKNPAVISQLPELVKSMQETVFTDVSPEQIASLLLLLPRLEGDDILFANPPAEVLTDDVAYIPSIDYEMQILRWDNVFTSWLYRALWQPKE